MATETKKTCPECGQENPGDGERCSKCDFPLAMYGDYHRVRKISDKALAEEAETARKEKESKNPPAKKQGTFWPGRKK